VALFGRHGTDPVAAFLSGLDEKHDLSDTVFLVDQFGYRTALSRLGLSGRVDYTDRNIIETWFHTLRMRVDRFHSSWGGSRRSVRQSLAVFEHYYDYLRPNHSLDGRTRVEEMLKLTVILMECVHRLVPIEGRNWRHAFIKPP
jgi:putative transposase